MKRVLNVVRKIFVGVLMIGLLANLALFGVRAVTKNPQANLFGWSWAIVLSGSMEPTLQVNDVVVFHEQDQYETGDIIAFTDDSAHHAITHRIVEMNDEGYRTQGDANNVADASLVQTEQVIGKVVCSLPYVGSVLSFVQTPYGFLLLCLIMVGCIEGPYWLERWKNKNQERKD